MGSDYSFAPMFAPPTEAPPRKTPMSGLSDAAMEFAPIFMGEMGETDMIQKLLMQAASQKMNIRPELLMSMLGGSSGQYQGGYSPSDTQDDYYSKQYGV